MPFKVQNMISENIRSIISIKSDQYPAFKDAEYKSYKRFHRNVLHDEGIPLLKKRAY